MVILLSQEQQNVISSNGHDGVYIGEGALVNQIDGNYIGSDPTGKNAIGNSQNGVAIVGGTENLIGALNTDVPLSSIASYDSQNNVYNLNILSGGFSHGKVHNVISGNGQNGVYINLDSFGRDQNGNPVKDSNGNIKKVLVAHNFVLGNYIGT